ncbi:hypothetical protein OG568_60660 (plasmid) [Streptomyces sp. NBC_01450]|uniref:transposase n=1 Tax=Streptomyces sp. NBC_01450 TaxID=2903871 RepID=UPI002E35FB52|nr:transposase [Streptomyces sp. NBC_01450]
MSTLRGTPQGSRHPIPSPLDRRKTGRKRDLICDGRGTPLKFITTAGNVNAGAQTLDLIDGFPPVAGHTSRPGRRRCRCRMN